MVLPNKIFIAKHTFECRGCFQWEPPVEFPSCGSICPACQELPSCIGSPPEKSSIVLFFVRQDVPVLRLQYWFFFYFSKTGFTCLSFSMSTADGSLTSPTKVLTKYRTWAKTSLMSKCFLNELLLALLLLEDRIEGRGRSERRISFSTSFTTSPEQVDRQRQGWDGRCW